MHYSPFAAGTGLFVVWYVAPAGSPPALVARFLIDCAGLVFVTILAFFVCCLSCLSFPGIVTGVVAIVFASKVNGLLNQGDLEGARRASANAKTWCWVATGMAILGLLINIGYGDATKLYGRLPRLAFDDACGLA